MHDSIRDSDSVALVLWFDSWFGFGQLEYMIRIRDSDSAPMNLWFGFGHSEFMIRIRDSPNHNESRIIWFANHMIRRSLLGMLIILYEREKNCLPIK